MSRPAGTTPDASLRIEALEARLAAIERARHEPIALIGMSCRFPAAPDVEAFWDVLRNGVDAISETPASRWDVDAWYDPTPGTPAKLVTRFGGFIDDPDLFDAQFFGISPREAARTDPQQRLLLEVSWEALERAGLSAERLAGSKGGVFVGISNVDYARLQVGDDTRIDAYAGTGNATSIAANRLSYVYDFRGPSLALDTACSSSLVAAHLAVQSLRRGECDLALAGGVNLILSPELTITFSHTHMLAADGRCKTFDAAADGYARGEGCGVLVLKRVSDAERDGDPILAVILGSAVNQDGRSNGLTAPNGLAQQAVMRAALADARVTPDQIGYVEAHGTGTILGDPIEMSALGAVLGAAPRPARCLIGSVKTNIGHLEAAAGVAALMKTVLQLQHKQVVPHLHFTRPNPYIPFDELPVEVPVTLQPWPTEGQARHASVNSFGFGGTNAHVVMGPAPAREMTSQPDGLERTHHILALPARSEAALRELAGRYAAFLDRDPQAPVADVAHTANTGRSHFRVRTGLVVRDRTALKTELAAIAAGARLPGSGANLGLKLSNGSAKVAFLFTGQGSQYPHMGRVLYETHPLVRSILDRCDAALRRVLARPLLSVLFPRQAADRELINDTTYTQPALFAIEVALAELWRSWDVRPDYLLGHSVGEFAAACIAGVYNLEDGLRLVAERGRLMGLLPSGGAMAAIFAEPDRVVEATNGCAGSVSVAAVNGPRHVVISGEAGNVAALVSRFQAGGVTARPLVVSHAFHSPQMEPILNEWEAAAASVHYAAPTIPVISNLTGEVVSAFDAQYWRRHVREAVQFDQGIHALAAARCQVFIEMGPAATLVGMGKCSLNLPPASTLWLPSLQPGEAEWETLLRSVSELYCAGGAINWVAFDAPYRRHKLVLPTYPFQRERFWSEAPQAALRRRGLTHVASDVSQAPDQDAAGSSASAIEDQTRPRQDEATSQAAAPGAASLTPEALLEASPEERLRLLTGLLSGQIGRVLGLPADRISPDHRLNHLGLDSIMSIELKSSIEAALKVDLPVAALLQGPSVAEVAEQLARLIGGSAEERVELVANPGPETGDFPLSAGQRALWLQHQVAPGSVYNPVYAARICAPVDVERLAGAFRALVERHPALRTSFHADEGRPFQRVHAEPAAHFETVAASGWTEAELEQRMGDAAYAPFDLESGPLLRVFLFDRGAADPVLLLAAHHLVTDLWTLAVLVSEVGTLYRGAGPGDAPPVRYTDFVDWQERLLAGPAGEKMLAWWRDELAGELPELNLPCDRPRPPVQTFPGGVESLLLSADITRGVRELSSHQGVTPYVTLLTAFQVLLHRYTGQDDIITGSPTTGRSRSELAGVAGYFVSPVAVRTRFDDASPDGPRFTGLLPVVNEHVLGALAHADYPFPMLVEKLRPHRDPSRTPIFQVVFALQRSHLLYEEGLSQFATGASGSAMQLGDLPLESVAISRRMSPFDLTMLVTEGAELGVAIEYNTDLFDAGTVRRMLAHYRTLLESIVAAPDTRVQALALMPEDEAHRILSEWSTTGAQPLACETIIQAFEAQVARTPAATALYFDPGGGRMPVTLTYAALDAEAETMARRLTRLGIGAEQIVALCLDRSPEMIVAILGVLKAGAAYLPLDPAAPVERLTGILRDAGPAVVVSTTALCNARRVQELPIRVLKIDAPDGPEAADHGGEWTPPAANNLAYVIYTSGSTGAPKGVMLEHRGLVNLVQEQVKAFDVTPQDRVFQFASYTFDASVSEIFIALTSGAALHIGRQETVLSPENLARALREQCITNITLPPTLLRLLDPAALPALRTLISAGEACTQDIVVRWAPGRRFLNAYGPTETTVGPTFELVNDGAAVPGGTGTTTVAPIGRPIHNVAAYVLDRNLRPVPTGVPGELCIGGIALARGYLRRPELTAERFVPFSGRGAGSARVYRTGDLVRFLPDGRIELVGRRDDQVKIRGFRVELGEIEAVLGNHPEVKQAVVKAFNATRPGAGAGLQADPRLVAYVVPGTMPGPRDMVLRDYLHLHLPEYMTPSAFVTLETLPLNASGKVDRKALARPGEFRLSNAEPALPASQLESDLVALWCSVLGVERVGVDDNFFDLGGHSLLMAQAHSRLQTLMGREIPIVELFRFPTVRLLARHLGENGGEGRPSAAVQQGKDRAQQQREALEKQRERAKALQQKHK